MTEETRTNSLTTIKWARINTRVSRRGLKPLFMEVTTGASVYSFVFQNPILDPQRVSISAFGSAISYHTFSDKDFCRHGSLNMEAWLFKMSLQETLAWPP